MMENRTFRKSDLSCNSYIRVYNHIHEIMHKLRNLPLLPSYREWEYFMVIDGCKLYNKKMNILDVGCGNSIFPALLASMGHNVKTVDFNFANVQNNFAEALGLSYLNLNSDVCAIPERVGNIELITCISVLEHTLNPVAILSAMKLLLQNHGTIAVTVDFSDEVHIIPLEDPLYYRMYEEYGNDMSTVTTCTLLKWIDQSGLRLSGDFDYTITDKVSEAYTLASAFLWKP